MFGITDLKPGDIINYKPVVDNNFNIPEYEANQKLIEEIESLTWKIWKIENDNYIIVPETSTTSSLNIRDALSGYNNFVQMLHAYCRKYYSDVENGVYARSVNMTDLESSMTEFGKIAKSSTYNETYNTIVNPTIKTNYPGVYSLETSNTINQSDSPLDNVYAPWNGENTKNDGETVYSGGYKVTTYFLAYDDIVNNNYFDNVTEELFFKNNQNYWIATRMVNVKSDYAEFGGFCVNNNQDLSSCRFYDTDGDSYGNISFALKPIITISKSKILKYIANKSSKTYTVGQEVTIKEENFYVIEASDSTQSTVKLLAAKNITTDTLQQSDSAPKVAFSSTNYWSSETEYPVNLNNYTIPDEETSIISIAKAYGEKVGGTETIGRLMTVEEVDSLGGERSSGNTSECPLWVKASYWLGSAHLDDYVKVVM